MDIRNCPECGRLFNFIRSDICPECKKKTEQQFETIKQYILRNPKSNVARIAEDTEIPEKVIAGYIKEGRIVLGAVVEDTGVNCELCGISIRVGRFCEACAKKLREGFEQSEAEVRNNSQVNEEKDPNKPEWSRSRFRK